MRKRQFALLLYGYAHLDPIYLDKRDLSHPYPAYVVPSMRPSRTIRSWETAAQIVSRDRPSPAWISRLKY